MSRKASAKTQATIRRQQKSGARVEDRVNLRDLGYQLAAGARFGEDDIRVDDNITVAMFAPDDRDGVPEPANGVWSFGPPVK